MKAVKIKRALLSVSDKTGIIPLAKALAKHNCELISTGGTKRILENAGFKVTPVENITGNPEAFGGRMKTISFHIESALLFDREKDASEAAALSIQPLDLVVCNLYPFQQTLKKDAALPELIENIDIGGPTMLRAAAKNYRWVSVLTHQQDYTPFITELNDNNGMICLETRFNLMRKAFNHTADYDAAIALAMDREAGVKSFRQAWTNGKTLRYGENSHQQAVIYQNTAAQNSLADLNCLHGKEISYNNILDIESAVKAVSGIDKQAVAIVKHLNPCGFAVGENQREVFEKAWSGDPVSAFGSIIAFNHPLQLETAQFLQLKAEDKSQRKFIEVIIAPEFSDDAYDYLCFHKNLRIVRYDPRHLQSEKEYRCVYGALLEQDSDSQLFSKIEQVTLLNSPSQFDQELLTFGLRAVRNVKSNAIVVVQKVGNICRLLGMGCGQPNRLISTHLAIAKAKENLLAEADNLPDNPQEYCRSILQTCLLVSDAYFPFADNIELAATEGIRFIAQPGGSIRDKKVFKRAEELGVVMLLTGLRHFKH